MGYLGRYTYRVAISNHRIVSVDQKTVRFGWRDYADGNRQKVMSLSHEEFIRRFLQHVLPSGFCKTRYYGILSNRCRKKTLIVCRRTLGVKSPAASPPLSWQECYRQATGIDWNSCPCCGQGRMLTIACIPSGRSLPRFLHIRITQSANAQF